MMLLTSRDRAARPRPIAVLAAALSLVAGCGSGSATVAPTAAAQAGPVTVAESEFKLDLGATTAKAGPVTFSVTNNGTIPHEFVVFRTDLAVDKLPLTADGTGVDEKGAGVTVVDELKEVAVGATTPLLVTLPAGKYVLICNLPGHYRSGMHVQFTTSG